ncbi:hypothetical protein E2562_001583 [Oryza meyeriana var. granulata]|uniref:Uncharacterized protein n=1 Tax=Oryza meyeriana var. granulata TaxID=110450 RepID=A0A6G1CCX3_9ORYZ|nr:hypothetical protein E2562_001583 [Oryza meyeriana var. granulata]
MTQKQSLFKGQGKKKTIPPNRHGKAPHVRKGTRRQIDWCSVLPWRKRAVKPTKFTKDMDADKELTKFINQCNEKKAASLASKEGGDLSIVKAADVDVSNSN